LKRTVNETGSSAAPHADLAIIGSGMAAARLVETLRKRGDTRSIVLLGAERSLPYNRIMLSPLLAGETDWQQLITRPAEWYEQNGVELRLGAAVVAIDRAANTVHCADGAAIGYDSLVFATGSRAAMPAIPGIDLPGVMGFRNFDDVTALQHASARGGHAVVLGGGLLGLEAAVALAARGMKVTLVHRSAQLMNRQLDGIAAACLQRAIEQRGVCVRTGVAPARVHGVLVSGVGHPTGVELANGEIISADLVVAATGIKPVVELAQQSGLAVNHGIVVDAAMRTSDAKIFAIGECNELHGETVGLVAPIWQQVDVLAANLCGDAKEFQQQPFVTMLKVSGIDVHVMGELEPRQGDRVLTYQDRGLGIYKKLVLRNGPSSSSAKPTTSVAAALLFGDVADSQLFFNLITRQSDVGANYCRLLLAGEHTADLLATA
jgi:nitrite reductase (NADH) large subunit